MKKGKLYAASINNDISDYIQWKLLAVHTMMFEKEGWIHASFLAPSNFLFLKTKAMKASGTWNQSSFDQLYKPLFFDQFTESNGIKSDSLLALDALCDILDSGQDVAVACYCSDSCMCHRSLLSELVASRGFEVEVINYQPKTTRAKPKKQ